MKLQNTFTQKLMTTLFIIAFFYIIFCFYEWNFNPGEWDTFSRVAVICLTGFVSVGESQK